ncbi:hypothetical protein OHB24_25845 [Kribbella sp. NBC_00482]|uniref:hypothetical protein n=1 Tax=Kribbella sp. NBC_00482 TaxID=2975968 RepID=UPI002E172DD2
MTVNGSGSAPEETPREIAERELLAAREDVQQMAEDMRARLKQGEQGEQGEQDQQDEQTAGE